MKRRRPGLQNKWPQVINSLQEIIPSYERASSRISLYADLRMRPEAVNFAVRSGALVLDLGAGPGTMSRLVSQRGGIPVLVDVSRPMLNASSFENKVQAVFEHLPFRAGCFDAVVSGFAIRDAEDLLRAVSEVARILKLEGKFSFCDLGRPDSDAGALALACYLRIVPGLIGLMTVGRAGLRYGSIYDTYVLTLRNSELSSLLSRHFREVRLVGSQLGGSIVVKCSK
jgi:ubiquinone/menaquinone biosynthesis C-methylase UbiE